MNSYLLLENGVIIDCDVATKSKNIFGQLTQTKAGVSLRCCTTGEDTLISSNLDASVKPGLMAKIVTDALPLEYHLYDLKSAF